MPRMFADLHVHPTLYNFNRMRNHDDELDASSFHPWTVPASNLDHMAKGMRAQAYSQADVPKLLKSGTRIVYSSICPIEKGFFHGHSEDGKEKHPFMLEFVKLVTGATLVESTMRALQRDGMGAAASAAKILANRGPLRQFIQKMFLKYGLKRIAYLSSDEYDYWGEFWREYEFLRVRDGVNEQAQVDYVDDDGNYQSERVSGAYHLIKSAEQFEELINSDTKDIAFLHTIEGAYVFTVGTDGNRVPIDLIFERIKELKAMEWPLLFLTVAHHFDNGICGHAHSMPDAANLVMDQSRRLNEGFERGDNDLGMRVVRELLDLDENLDEQGGRRILIDCKHFSARSRKEYYEEVVKPYNAKLAKKSAKHRKENLPIPVFMSHVGYSGISSIDELIKNAHLETDHYHAPPFYAWNINASDDDIRMVHATDGLLGLVFDQRVCGVGPRQKIADGMWPHVFANHILAMVDVIMNDDRLTKASKKKVWDNICLGTDYDGLIDPFSRYPTCIHLDRFAEDLAEVLRENEHTRYIKEIGVDVLVEKICWENGYKFALKHLPAACR